MNRNNGNALDRMAGVDGGHAQDLGRGFHFGVCGIFVLALLIAFSIHVVYPQDAAETTVVGQNDPAVDVQAVQDAVDHFDIVNLVGTFHFGDKSTPYTPTDPWGGIRITRAGVTLRGEGRDATRIVGGGRPMSGEGPDWPTPLHIHDADGVKIHDLTLDGYLGWAILVEGCHGFESIGVRIVNGVPGVDGQYRFDWYFGGLGGLAPVTGDVLIQDCEYRSVGAVEHWEDAITAVYGRCDANFRIINNTLEVGSRINPVRNNDAIQVVAYTNRIRCPTRSSSRGTRLLLVRGST